MLCQAPKSQIKTIPAQQLILRVPSQSGGSWPNQKPCWMSQLLCTSWPLLLHTGGCQAPLSTHLSQSCSNDGAVMLWFTQHKPLPTMQWQNQAEKKWCPTSVWWSEHQSPWGQEERVHDTHPKNAAIWADFTGRHWDKESRPLLLLKLEETQQGVLAHLPPPENFSKISCSLSGQRSLQNSSFLSWVSIFNQK